MAISSLSTLSTDKYRGGSYLAATAGLATDLNTMISKINEIISGIGTADTATIGAGSGPYYGGSESWLSVDGTNPPTLARLRMQDQTTGGYRILTINNGLVVVV